MSRLKAEMRIKESNRCSSLCNKVGRERVNLILLLLLSIISTLSFAPPCAAQSGYEIRNAVVTPEYGYEDFTYSAQVWMSEEAASKVGVIAVTKFSLKLNIYDDGKLIHSESSPSQTGMGKSSFTFGPYSFKNRFGITSTSNATFEFIFYAGGQQVAKTPRIKGPIVQPPTITGIQYEKNPYFFQGISVSAGFKDMDELLPAPTCHLEIAGPLGVADSRSWITADISCQASGKSTYSCTISEDLSSYRDGGNFSFKLVYNNLKLDPLIYGPYNVSLQPYNPAIEKVSIPKLLDYTNFTIQAYVRDAGVKMLGGSPYGSMASLIISHPQKGEMAYASSEPTVRGSSLVYEWTNANIPALFNRSDVQLAKNAPFLAKVIYKNENWDYQAEKSNLSFKVVEEIPKLDLQYPSNVYVRAGESTAQDIIATVTFSKGAGEMNFKLSGPDQNLDSTEKAVPLGGGRYQFKKQVTFDDRHINNNYTLTLSFVHPTLEDGRYTFEDKFIKVSPLSVQFSLSDVSPTTGLWNDSYTYSLKIDTTIVPLDVRLQTYDPCTSEWTDKGAKKATAESSLLNWTLKPFYYECKEMQQQGAKYRFKASFAGNDYFSKPYYGPRSSPVLISLDSDPVVYVTEGSESSSSIVAVVEYGAGQGQATLWLEGPEKSLEETSQGIAQDGNRYRYEWSLPFDEADIGKNFNYTISYKHASLAAEMQLAEEAIAVKEISISFGDANVAPEKGKWNETYAYSVPIDTSVEMKVALEIYNPCRWEWVERASGTVSPGESLFNLTAQPFQYKCADAEGKEAHYRFVARMAEERFESKVYFGPFINGGKPELVSVDFEPILQVSEDAPAYQSVKATVDFQQGQDAIEITTVGPDKIPATEEMKAVYLGATQYLYTWSKEFGKGDVGNHTISLHNVHPKTAGGEIAFTGTMTVVLEKTDSGLEPKAIGDVNYLPVLFVTPDTGASQALRAEVFSPGGKGTLTLNLTGEGKNKQIEMSVTDLGGNRYRYDYAEPFDATHAGNSYMFSLDYQLDGNRYGLFNNHLMQVALEGTEPQPIWEPKLLLEYDTTLYVPAGGKADQLIHATINYSESGGILKLKLAGPNKNFTKDLSDRAIGLDKYLYEAEIPFDENDIGNSFTISLAFNHTRMLGRDFRFADHYMRVLRKASASQQGSSGTGNGGQINRVFNDSAVTVIGNVTPAAGVIQAWDEKDLLHVLTYTLQLENWSSQQVPWIELSVRPFGSDQPWKIVGDKKRYNPAKGSVSWTLKPFWETPFLGMAEYRFLIDGAETKVFEGPNIIAVVYNPTDSWTVKVHNFEATINATENLTVCLVGGDNRLPEKIKSWTPNGQCMDYRSGSGEQTLKWQAVDYRPLYYDFDIRAKGAK